jgi:hypothetical protein
MFANDLLLFGEANERQIKCIMEILNKFCKMSRQEVSNEKTSILFSKNVDKNIRHRLVQLSGSPEMDQLGKYLGVPLISGANDRWCEVMRGKYDCRALMGETNVQGTASSLRKYIVKLSLKLYECCFWAIVCC